MVDQKLIDYVKSSVAQGRTKEELYKELLGKGWSIDDIQESFNSTTIEEEKEDTSKRTIQIIVTIGVLLVGAGIFSFIAANWQGMSKIVRVGVIIFTMLASYSAGWIIREKYNLNKTGNALLLLGSITYGSGIFLVGQMFNIRGNWPDGFILWMMGSIAMAFAVESYGLFYISIVLGFIAVQGYPVGIFGSFGQNSFLLTSTFLLIVSTIITFATGWIIRKRMSPDLKEFY